MYTVEKILDKRETKKKGKFQFLVKWDGWEESQATWEPEANLKYIKELIDKFNEEHQNKSKQTYKKAEVEIETTEKEKEEPKQESKAKMNKSRKKETKKTRGRNKKEDDKEEVPAAESPVAIENEEDAKEPQDNPVLSETQLQKTQKKPKKEQGKEKGIKIIGMKKQDNEFMYFAKINDEEGWHRREEIISKYSVELCQFYEERIVFD